MMRRAERDRSAPRREPGVGTESGSASTASGSARTRVLEVNARVAIPLEEIEITADTHGGPGGQHANRSATRVTVRFPVTVSTAFSEAQKARIVAALGARLAADGTLRVVSARERSQLRNRRAALARLADMLAEALRPRRQRRATAPTAASRRERVAAKRRRAEIKVERRPPAVED